ncbi:replication-relaxation family protein [Frankia sp. AgB1.9]|uniref:replication-relaxation family protein n=1 Tax=unclassified Frankia TaxID=2632575 RepID=UPI0019337047|nr:MULTISPECIES: replication-relaxation family protein [unclassified Frankia]MBL7490807.1 replication-relaxation family protein [Frankia sp. AgW1.1]MBL7552236.1 replication-relaxation family protein [Frankia sp. AgB1.9]MBL7622005.1 replication-relaxation family protein [Frankia sp. AgB1.8]
MSRPNRRAGRTAGGGGESVLFALAGRLTARDRWLLDILADHQVLTTDQITRLCFENLRTAQVRLATLAQLGVLDRAKPFYGPHAGRFHYTLGPAGARLLAAHRGLTLAELGYRRDALLTLLVSPRIAHLIGVNGFFVGLAHASRTLPAGQGLTVWWSEARAAAMWGGFVRPDGYGTWHTGQCRLDFHVEYDTGSETLARVHDKLPGYARLATASGISSPLLLWLPSPAREAHLRARLASGPPHAGVPVLTASPEHPIHPGGDPEDTDPAAAVWLPLDATRRLTIAQLADRYGAPHTPAAHRRPAHP